MKVQVFSEIGKLEGVILHKPGREIENMTPKNAERALYSDILNLSIASYEYQQLYDVLSKFTKTFEMDNLLIETLKNEKVKRDLVYKICVNENAYPIYHELLAMNEKQLACALIEGVEMQKDNLTKFLSEDRYSLQPLHNFFYMRDASVSMHNQVLICRMANVVRDREALIMETIFMHNPNFSHKVINPTAFKDFDPDITMEGGDILIAREDVLVIGLSQRTNSKSIDFLIERFKEKKTLMNIVIQELPHSPESFIHLDMVFTFLDVNACMAYEPIVMKHSKYQAVHIRIDNGKVDFIRRRDTLFEVLKDLKFDLNPIMCGGTDDSWIQQREQWHSGANFFAMAPGKVIGYGRNINTIEALNKNGFEVLTASEIASGKTDMKHYERFVVTIEGSELSRGGGGARCMTMPVRREKVNW